MANPKITRLILNLGGGGVMHKEDGNLLAVLFNPRPFPLRFKKESRLTPT